MQPTLTRLLLSATDLANHLACRHLTGLDLAVARDERQKPEWRDPKVQTLAELGLRHERAYIEHLRSKGKFVVELSQEERGATAVKKALEAMQSGADVITQVPLADDQWHGRADVLLRVEQPSDLGGWSYEVADTKLSANTKGGTVLQLCLYSDLVGRLQGRTPEHMYVVPPSDDFEPEVFRFDDYAAYYRQVRGRLVEAVTTTDEEATYPYPVPHCDVCKWWSVCDAKRRSDDHLSLVAGVTRLHTKELEERGCKTLEKLVTFPPFKPSRGSSEAYERLRHQARVQSEARQLKQPVYELLDMQPGEGLHRLPEPSPGDVYFDIEGDRFVGRSGLEYLFGIVVRSEGTQLEYNGYWALTQAEEKSAFEQLVDWLIARWERFPDLHIYHYNHYEPTALKRLMSQYGSREDEIDRLLRGDRFVDLYSIVRQSIRAGVESYSLKQLEPFYGFEREVDLREEATPNLRVIERALELGQRDAIDEVVRTAVEGYNREDCVSTAHLQTWMEQLRGEYVAAGNEVSRPVAGSGEPSDQLDDELKEIRRLAEALTLDLPEDVADRSAEHHARWMLAHLLEWQRRETKVTYWEYLRLVDLSEEDLADEPSAVSGLHNHVRVDGGDRLDAYEYPRQEVKVKKGDKLQASTGEKIGAVADIDPVARVVTIKKTKKYLDLHPPAVFAYSGFFPKDQPKALRRIAAFVIREGMASEASDYSCGRRLLMRRPPTALAVARSADAATPIVDVACTIVHQLDGDCLAIQGPPGSGKTYAGARMICDLVREGKKVGITATSHKVIRHLLDEVVKIGGEMGVDVHCIQKPKSGGMKPIEDQHPRILETTDYAVIHGAMASGDAQVVAGTSWMWAREDFSHSVDVLFVDEASQMSLANVLAVSQGARNLVLLGDPAQLDQPQKASHPEGTDVAALDYVLGDAEIMPPEKGLFIDETRRLHPAICSFTSELFYRGELHSLGGLERQRIIGHELIKESGLYFHPVDHEGNRNESLEEAEAVKALAESLVAGGVTWVDEDGKEKPVTLEEVLIVAAFNAHVTLLQTVLPDGARVGTVDKFQGQEAPVVIYSYASSSPEDAPRGLEFLYSLNRLNVATSRARCACVLVANPRLLEAECRTPRQMMLVNALCRYREMAVEMDVFAGTL